MRKTTLKILVIISSHFIIAQEDEFTTRNLENFFHWFIEISVESEDGDDFSPVMFGVDPDATDGFDYGLDIYAPPPPPPMCWFIILMDSMYHRYFVQSNLEEMIIDFVLSNAANADGYIPNIMSWDPTGWANIGSFILRDPDGVHFNIDMTNPDPDSLNITEEGILGYDFSDSTGYSLSLGYLIYNMELVVIPNGNSGYWLFGPTVDFYTDVETVVPEQTIQFSGEALLGECEIASWFWDFGDGNTSDLQNPVLSYSEPGVYTVSLTVTDENGDSATETKTDYITVSELYFIEVNYSQNWNLFGIPFELNSFPCSGYVDGSLYSFEGGSYENASVDNMSTGSGYWLRFDEAEICTFSGEPIAELTISLNEGWNLISGISFSVPVDSIIDPDNLIIPGTVYGFELNYGDTEILEPGYGYWIRANNSGTITIIND